MSFTEINHARYSSHFYLSSCDLLNKNTFNNFCNKPRVEKIFLELSPNSLDLLEDSFQSPKNSSDDQIEAFLVLYSIRLHRPFVLSNCLGTIKKDSNICSIKVVLSNEEDIYLFLLTLFIENIKELVVKDFSVCDIKTNSICESTLERRNFAINMCLFVGSFFELEDFSVRNNFNLELRKSSLKVRFLFDLHTVKNLDLSKEYIKNIPLFWISC